MMRRVLVGAAVVAWVVACSGSSSEVAATVDSTCPAFAEALCAKTSECNAALVTIGFGTLDACKARFLAVCKAAGSAPSTGITPQKIQSCADAQKGLACSEYYKTGISSVCPAIAGSLSNGSTCLDDAQCQSSFCSKALNTLCGACATAPGAGASCSNLKCASGLACTSSGTCAVVGSSGQKCTTNADCAGDLRCNKGTCGAPAKIGEACSLAGDTAPQCDPVTTLWCNPLAKKCETFKTAVAGAPCGLDIATGSLTACESASYCKIVDEKAGKGTCTVRSADGAACANDALGGGSSCLASAVCESGVCRFPDANACTK